MLSFGHGPLLLVLGLALAAALAWWAYGRMVPTVPRGRRALLAGLRGAALALLLVLLFRPVWRSVEAREEPPVVAVLVDASQSLDLGADSAGAGPGAEAAREALRRLPELEGRLYRYAFAGDVRPLAGPADSLAFSGGRTNISGALERLEQDLAGQNLRGVVLISDGRYNTGRNPVYLAERYGVPIHTAVVGDTSAQRDVVLARVLTNEVAYVGVELPVRVGVRAEGFGGERAVVTLHEGSTELAREALTLPEGGLEASVELAFTPEAEGFRRYTASVTRFEGELTHANNAESFAVRVLESKRRVLLVAAAPSPDLAAVRASLEADPNVEITSRIQKGPGAFYEGPAPADLGAFDLAVLVGYPGRAADRSVAARLAAAAEEGLPLLFILTQQTDLGALRATLGEVLPAVPEAIRAGFSEAELVPTAAGTAHPVLDIPEAPPAELGALPPALLNESRWRASPDARVLATARVHGVALEDPVLALQQRGASRSAALLAAGTWRWRNLPADLRRVEGFYPGLLANLTRWLTAREDQRPVRVRPTHDLFAEDEAVAFSGQVYDESLEPVSDAAVVVDLRAPDGTTAPYPMRALGHGRYALEAGPLPAGDYTFSATAERAGHALGEDRGAFAVGALALEARDTRADPALMRQIARRSGGEVVEVDEIPAFLARLEASGRLAPRLLEEERETELWHVPWLLGLAVALLAAEWVLRKRSGMV